MVLPPATPRPDRLPLNDPNFPWERFESFCSDLIARIPAIVKECHRYGKQGNSQKGIDIFADSESGERWAFQCRQYDKYTKSQTQETIKSAKYPASRYILLLSCEATTTVRNEVGKHPNWDVWDVNDISQKVRKLPVESARYLIYTHFGTAWRTEFLGGSGLTTFVSSENFFRPLLNANNLFNHTWSFVGRADLTEKLQKFVELDQKRVAILPGRGGIGKTKLLHAFAGDFSNRHPKLELRFWMEGAPITGESLDELPAAPCVIVVDDAHRREDLRTLFSAVQQRHQELKLKLVLSCRPQGINRLSSLLTQAGFDSREIEEFKELKELSREDVKALACQALGSEFAYLADSLAAFTWDCPLITVVGGRLVADKKISPQLLERDKGFQKTVLTRFTEVRLGQVSDLIDRERCQSLLKLIAAAAPICPDNEPFQQAAAEFLGVERPVLVKDIDILEESGVLIRRGDTLQITPDVLSDHILHEACLTARGKPTGYAQQVFEKFKSLTIVPNHVLPNLAELDWRIRHASGEETDVLTDIWQTITEQFRNASHSDRDYLLHLLTKVAEYQPKRMLELVEFAMRNPATTTSLEDDWLPRSQQWTHADVLSQLPELLRRISYTPDYRTRCWDLLWELGRHESPEVNNYPGDAIQTLIDFEKYDLDKSRELNQAVWEEFPRWLKARLAKALE
ncbi:MAG: hypothetical protein KME26_12480 [Oscillatoria princeps RMCB-10]|jgi:hypothetical protein|nr:hypothetical protein [Oscillatoria princeps RMCB-10]